MSRITKFIDKPGKERVWVYIDDQYCTSIRKRTWVAMDLSVGSEIDCNQLKEKENFFWKQAYGEKAWEKENIRLNRLIAWFKKYIPQVQVRLSGFGTGTTELIEKHPEDHGEPDLSIYIEKGDRSVEIIALEVTGTEKKRGDDLWIRPDKIQYAQNNPERDVWLALHYKEPYEKIYWLKPKATRKYRSNSITIRGAIEKYVIFSVNDEEIYRSQQFKNYILDRIKTVYSVD